MLVKKDAAAKWMAHQTCVLPYGSRPICNRIDRENNSPSRIDPPVELIAKNSSSQAKNIGHNIKVMVLDIDNKPLIST